VALVQDHVAELEAPQERALLVTAFALELGVGPEDYVEVVDSQCVLHLAAVFDRLEQRPTTAITYTGVVSP
jgi:hypothetical protein